MQPIKSYVTKIWKFYENKGYYSDRHDKYAIERIAERGLL